MLSFVSDERFAEPIVSLCLRPPPDESAEGIEKTLTLDVNQGMSTFTRSDVELWLHGVGSPIESESSSLGSGPTIIENRMEYSLPDSKLRFVFLGSHKRLMEIVKVWKVPASKLAAKKPIPVRTPDASISQIKKDISTFHYKKAASTLMSAWDAGAGDARLRAEYRELLVKCYQGLKKPEVADYLKTAPYRHINRMIICKQADPDKLDLTLDTYMHHLWKVRGQAEKDNGKYELLIPEVENPWIYASEHPNVYAEVFKLVGPMTEFQQKKIPPIAGQLIDQVDFAKPKSP